MTTRVHELAKELGLKTNDLLDRIQRGGLEVKSNPLASLDESMVARIKELIRGPMAEEAASHGSVGPPPSRSTEKPAISPTATATRPPGSHAAESTISTPVSPSTAADAPSSGRAPVAPSQHRPSAAVELHPDGSTKPAANAHAANVAVKPAPQPAHGGGATTGQPQPNRPAAAAQAVQRPHAPQVDVPHPPKTTFAAVTPPVQLPHPIEEDANSAARSTSSAPQSQAQQARGGVGPLAGHTHRTGTGGGSGGGLSSRMGSDSGRQQPHLRPGSSSSAPLKRSDYISPSGTRGMAPTSQASSTAAPPQRPSTSGPTGGGGGSGGASSNDSNRRESTGSGSGGGRRPLPPIAPQVASPPPRRGDVNKPRPANEPKTQRPETKFTPAQLRELIQTGQFGAVTPGVTQAGGGGRGGAPGRQAPTGRGPIPAQQRPDSTGQPPRRPGDAAAAAPTPAPAPTVMTDEEDDKKAHPHGRLGSPGDRAGRRAKRNERALERRVTSPLPAAALLNEDEEAGRVRGHHRRGAPKKHSRSAVVPVRKSDISLEPPITVRSLSMAIGVPAGQIISKLMNFGQLVNINANIDDDTASMLSMEFGIEVNIARPRTAEDDMLDRLAARGDEPANLIARPPVVTILGHVDHGKTSLLDRIRQSNVAKSESGGITQHIGAYQVEYQGKKITFVDTPGHEAFTAMRARGANVTDIVVLVVAADDGVMPQTVEAIAHAKAAGVPIVVALNKIDLPGVNLNKIYGELSQQDLVPQEYGGETEVVKTSALTGLGIPELLETLGIIADLRELKADPSRTASGTCLEASLSEGRGVLATVLVQDGTLKVGDVLVCGDGYGRVRALFDDQGETIVEAGPSTPVEISGLDEVPSAGEKFAVVPDIARAREIAEARRGRTRGVNLGERQAVTLENLFTKMTEQKIKSLNIILKADVQGSLEAIIKELEKLENPEVPIRILHKGVGGITESDVLLADASQAIIIGFRSAPEDRASSLADEKSIDIRRYDIIYQVTSEIKQAIEGMLVPEIKEVHLGRATVRQVFKISKVGAVAGCIVASGTIERGAGARIIREGREIYKSSIEALKRFKDDAREVREGFECGIKIVNFDDLKVGDTIEAYRIEKVRRTL